jgi:hypothetical protein
LSNHGIKFDHYLNHKSVRDVNATRMDYFEQRLAQAEERVFSHVDIYQKAKLTKSEKDKDFKIVHNVHSILGSEVMKWVLGIIT